MTLTTMTVNVAIIDDATKFMEERKPGFLSDMSWKPRTKYEYTIGHFGALPVNPSTSYCIFALLPAADHFTLLLDRCEIG